MTTSSAAPITPIKVTNGYHATQALPSGVKPAELTPAAFPHELPAAVGWEKMIGNMNTGKISAFDAAVAGTTFKAGGGLEQAVLAASQLAQAAKRGPESTSTYGVFADGSDLYVTPLWNKTLQDGKRTAVNIDSPGSGRGQAARSLTPEFLAAVGKSRWIDVRDEAPKTGTEHVIGTVKSAKGGPAGVTVVEADTSAKPVGQWNELYDAVREAAKLSEGADKPALALIRTGHDTISAFPLTGTAQGSGAAEPLDLEGAEAGKQKVFKRAVDAPQAKALRAIVDGRDFAAYTRPSDVPGTAMYSAIGNMSGTGLPAGARIVAKGDVGNHNGYGTLEAAFADVRAATAGTDNGPAVVVREADGRIYAYEAEGGYSKGSTFLPIDLNPLFEGAIGTPAAGKVALSPIDFKQYAVRMIGVVDGEYSWQREG